MKDMKQCVKCLNKNIIRVPGQVGVYGAGNNISVGITYIKVTRFVCSECGYIEEWIDNKDDLKK